MPKTKVKNVSKEGLLKLLNQLEVGVQKKANSAKERYKRKIRNVSRYGLINVSVLNFNLNPPFQ